MFKSILKRLLAIHVIIKFSKFAVSGLVCALLEIGIFKYLTHQVEQHYLVANAIAFTIAVLLNYYLSKYWVFEPKTEFNPRRAMIMFATVSFIGLGINQLLMFIFVDGIGLGLMPSKYLAIIGAVGFNFLGKKVVFEGYNKPIRNTQKLEKVENAK